MISGVCQKKKKSKEGQIKHWRLYSTIPWAQSLQMEFHKNAEPNSQLFVCWLSAAACQTGGVTVAPVSSPWYVSMAWHIVMDGQITCLWSLSGAELLKHPTQSWRSSSVPAVCSESGLYFTSNHTKSFFTYYWLSIFPFLSAHPEC